MKKTEVDAMQIIPAQETCTKSDSLTAFERNDILKIHLEKVKKRLYINEKGSKSAERNA